MKVTADLYDAMLGRVEADLLALVPAVETARVADVEYERAVLGCAVRACRSFKGALVLFGSDVPKTANALVRVGVEIYLTMTFLAVETKLHTELWLGEGDRQLAAMIREVTQDPTLLGGATPTIDPTLLPELERLVRDAREAALNAGVEGVSKTGAVMPSIETIAKKYGDHAAKQAYTLAYRPLSGVTHTSSRSFQGSVFYVEDDGRVSFSPEADDAEGSTRGDRALNANVFTATLELADEVLDIGVTERAQLVRSIVMTTTIA